MSARAVYFMHRWIDANVKEDQYLDHKCVIARALIARCHDDLADAGIAPHETPDDMEVTLETVIIEAMENRPEEEFAIKMAARIPRAMMH